MRASYSSTLGSGCSHPMHSALSWPSEPMTIILNNHPITYRLLWHFVAMGEFSVIMAELVAW